MMQRACAFGGLGQRSSRDLRRLLVRLLALLLAVQSMELAWTTQGMEAFLNVFLVWCSALVVLDGAYLRRHRFPGFWGCGLGMSLIGWVLWRSHSMVSGEMIFNFLPLVSGLGLALVTNPWRRLGRVAPALMILALLPLMRALIVFAPVAKLSLLTAGLTQLLLLFCGLPVQRLGSEVQIPGGGVVVAGACSGLNMLVQLLAVAIIFMIAFPMRYRWQNGLMILLAPFLGLLVNGMRIGLLALIVSSNATDKSWWFDFFHDESGAQIFSLISMLVFVLFYAQWQGRQVARLLHS